MSVVASKHAASVRRPQVELADVFARYGDAYQETHPVRPSQAKVMRAIVACRTALLGGRREWCQRCGFERYLYHSCRNRHCPKCQSLAKASWLADREREVLPVPYFHNVFTLPHELNPLILFSQKNQRALLNLLFQAASQTLLEFGRNNLGGKVGFTMVLHTWDQQLRPHFHVHVVIASGALAQDGRWIAGGSEYLFPVRALSQVFRAKYRDRLAELFQQNQLDVPPQLAGPAAHRQWWRKLTRKPWVVYSKQPFRGAKKLLDYLGRYTHRVAISNHRVISCQDGQVRFTYRDRRDGDQKKTLLLSAVAFIGRFLAHVLPDNFMRVRHYGFLASRVKNECLAQCREALGSSPPDAVSVPTNAGEWMMLLTGQDITRCPCCNGPLMSEPLAPQSSHHKLSTPSSIPTPDFCDSS